MTFQRQGKTYDADSYELVSSPRDHERMASALKIAGRLRRRAANVSHAGRKRKLKRRALRMVQGAGEWRKTANRRFPA